MKRVLLAGAFGTRFAKETGIKPKPPIKIGDSASVAVSEMQKLRTVPSVMSERGLISAVLPGNIIEQRRSAQRSAVTLLCTSPSPELVMPVKTDPIAPHAGGSDKIAARGDDARRLCMEAVSAHFA